MFLADGTPVRARLQVALTEFRNADFEAKQVKRETADYTKAHVVGSGETLPAIAAAVYEDPTAWRPIAVANDVDDPRVIEPGRVLVVPQLPFRDPLSGQVVT